MGISSSTQKSSSTQTSNGTSGGTTTPNVPDFALGPVKDYYAQVGEFGKKIAADPFAYHTPINGLLMGAENSAANLGGWQAPLGQSNAMAQSLFDAAPNTARGVAIGAQAPVQTRSAAGVSIGGLPPVRSTSIGATAPITAAQTTAQGYAAPKLGPVSEVQGASLLEGLEKYYNPYEDRVVKTVLADWDVNADRRMGDQLQAGAANRALSGSRFAIGQGVLEGELARGRSTTDAGIRSAGFDRATALSSQDADRRQQASMANAGARNTFALNQGGLDANALQFGADANNAASLFNVGQLNTIAGDNANREQARAIQQAGLDSSTDQFNAGQSQARSIRQAELDSNNNQFNTGLASSTDQFNSSQGEQRALTQAGLDADLNRFNAGQMDANQGLRMQAAGLLSGNAGQYGDSARGDLGLQLNVGDALQTLRQQQTMLPLTNMGLLNQLLDPSLFGAFTGQTVNGWENSNSTGTGTQTGPGWGQQLLGAGAQLGGAAILASDRRLKTAVERVGAMADGLGVYEYEYVWGGPRQRGVMADEVAELRPWALGPRIEGFATVDYGAL